MKIYIDGEYFDKENAKISVYDHGLLYGDGIFEGLRIYGGKIYKLDEHLIRLYESAKAIMLKIPLTIDELKKDVLKTFELNNKNSGYIRLIVTRGIGNLGIDPDKCQKASIIIIIDDIALYPEELYTNGIKIITAATRRISSDVFDVRVKSLNYLNNILAKIEAKQAGCLEAIILNKEGYVAECTGDNIFIIKNGAIFTPPAFTGALEGITKDTINKIANKENIPFNSEILTRFDIYNADECFLTGSAAEVMPVVSVDGRIINNGFPGKITKQLILKFREIVCK